MNMKEIRDRMELAGFIYQDDPAIYKALMDPERDAVFIHASKIMSVIISIAKYEGEKWIHVSLAKKSILPSWDEITFARDASIGREAKAIIVVAPDSEHVNINSNCMHLWHCLDKDPLPDFTMGMGTL